MHKTTEVPQQGDLSKAESRHKAVKNRCGATVELLPLPGTNKAGSPNKAVMLLHVALAPPRLTEGGGCCTVYKSLLALTLTLCFPIR